MAKLNITRTYGNIHFEDLDAHRFEDLVRELIYDLKEWQTIEATGRSGSDGGFDIRAYERLQLSFTEEGIEEENHPMEGNKWMIQCKRKNEIGPIKVEKIISEDIIDNDPPYGYILVAPANFSKKSYDIFRERLRKKGVMEFYLWGRAELEDMLHMPKNDRILFTFFGISLVSKRKSRTTELRMTIGNKNKLYKILGDGEISGKYVFIRDINDNFYPYSQSYSDFERNPRWQKYETMGFHVHGIWCLIHENFGYVDKKTKEWDSAESFDLIYREDMLKGDNDFDYYNDYHARKRLPQEFWERLPNSKKTKFYQWGLIKFEDIMLIDEKGDALNDSSHLFVDYKHSNGPFHRILNLLETNHHDMINPDQDGYKRINIFPATFSTMKKGRIYKDKFVVFDSAILKAFKNYSDQINNFYEFDDRYDFLEPGDIICVEKNDPNDSNIFLQITYTQKSIVRDYLEQNDNSPYLKETIIRRVGRDIDENELLRIFEFKQIHGHEFS